MSLTVITGATGQVGLHLLDTLVAQGRRVRAMVLPGDTGLDDRARRDGVEVVRGDVRDPESLRRAFEGADAVHHLAAVVSTSDDPRPLLFEVNVDGARNAAHAAREAGVRRFVHFASMVVFDPDPSHVAVDERRRRVCGTGCAPYTRSKVLGEEAVRNEMARGLDAVIVHPTVIVGPHETHHDGIVQGLIAKHYRGELPSAVSGGFDLVDVLDVVDGALRAEARGRRGESYILGGYQYTVRELLDVLAASSGRPAPRMSVPLGVARAALPLVDGFSRALKMDAPYDRESLVQLAFPRMSSLKAIRDLGYRPRRIDGAVQRVHRWLGETASA